MPTPPPTKTAVPTPPLPVWQRTLARLSPIAAGFTTRCCLGVPALVAFASSIGATFLTNDATLRPLLAATLLFTLTGSALTFRSHRNPATLIVTAIAAVMIYWPLYGPALGGHTERPQAGHEDLGTGLWVIAGLVLLVAAQVFDVWQLRRRRSRHRAAATDQRGPR